MDPRIALRDWLAARNVPPARFAKQVDYDRGNFHRLLHRADSWPSLELARRIEQQTQGDVPTSAWADAKAAA